MKPTGGWSSCDPAQATRTAASAPAAQFPTQTIARSHAAASTAWQTAGTAFNAEPQTIDRPDQQAQLYRSLRNEVALAAEAGVR